jgi:hypothetical protein
VTFGGSGNDGSPNTLDFTDGIDGETHGVFGAIESTSLIAASMPHPDFSRSGHTIIQTCCWSDPRSVARPLARCSPHPRQLMSRRKSMVSREPNGRPQRAARSPVEVKRLLDGAVSGLKD